MQSPKQRRLTRQRHRQNDIKTNIPRCLCMLLHNQAGFRRCGCDARERCSPAHQAWSTAPGTFWTHMGRVLRTLHATHTGKRAGRAPVPLSAWLGWNPLVPPPVRVSVGVLLFPEGRAWEDQPRTRGSAAVWRCGCTRFEKEMDCMCACIMRGK